MYFKSISDNTIALDDVEFQVNGLTSINSTKKELCIGAYGNLEFDEFKELKIHNSEDVKDKKWIMIYYKFEDPKIVDMDDLDFNVSIKSNFGVVNKKIKMERHSRYRMFLEGG